MERSENQRVQLPLLAQKQVILYLKREDLLYPRISGNKFRKLKYNLIEAEKQGLENLLTFGGAYSNHIAATAYAGQLHGIATIGIIRGEELAQNWFQNPTLCLAQKHGMNFKFVSRERYRHNEDNAFIRELTAEFGPFYMLPEGGSNALAVQGCSEILGPGDHAFDVICCAVGTGGTLAGLCNASQDHQQILGFQVLKGNLVYEDIRKFVRMGNWNLQTNYHFGAYAKVTPKLIDFINDFLDKTGIPLDPIYTGKMMYGILDMIGQNRFPAGSKILAIHTGGLQAIEGMNQVLKRKNRPIINI